MWNGAKILREKLQSGRFVTGFASTLSDPAVSEMAACAGYDFVFVDGEHPPMDRGAERRRWSGCGDATRPP